MNEVEAGRMPDIDPIPVAAVDREPQFSGMLNRLGIDLSGALEPFKLEETGEEVPHPIVDAEKHDFSGMLNRLGIDLSGAQEKAPVKTAENPVAPTKAIVRPHYERRHVADVAQPERVKPERRRLRPLHVGAVMLGLAGAIPGSLFAAEALDSRDSAPQAQVAAPFPPETEVPPTTEATVPTTEAPTTTTEAPAPRPPEFKVGHGERVGRLSIPAICVDVDIYAYNELEKFSEVNGEYNPNVVGSGNAVIDRTDPLSARAPACETVEQREAAFEAETGMQYTTRAERGNPMLYAPVGGFEQGWDGGLTSYYPGTKGVNSVIAGHGSTFSAPFADIGLLKPGDTFTFERSDGNVYNYVVIESQILPEDNYAPFLNYEHPNFKTTQTIFRCGSLNGLPGSREARFAIRAGLVEQQ